MVDLLTGIPNPADDDCFVYESGNNIATQSNLFIAMASVQMRNAGKGVTPAGARTGALCESIERYSACLLGGEIRKRARYCDFAEGEALMPNRVMNFSETQLAQSSRENRQTAGNPFVNIPPPLGEDETCEWSPVWSLTHARPCWLPTQALYYGYPYDGHWIAVPDTNGAAAGNTRTEAFVQAYIELLERDAVSIWWYNRLACAELALESVTLPLARRVVAQYQALGRRCWALDISFDLGVYVFAFITAKLDGDGGGEEICLGFAAHFDPEIALTRAICEHSQLWSMIENRREQGSQTTFRDLSPEFSAWLTGASTAQDAFAYLLPSGKKRWQDYPAMADFDLLQQRRACLELAQTKGWDVYLADFTRPSIGLPVIRVIIPALRSMHRRLGPGRLYDVPVELGLLARAKDEAEMNAVDIFI